MPRNGSGGYALPGGINPVITQTLITSAWANTTLSDVAQALTQSIARDGQTTPTANLPMGGFRHTGVGAPALRDNYLTLGYQQDGLTTRLQSVSGANSISSILPGGMAAYVPGQLVQLIPTLTSTGPVTLDINGIGARNIVSGLGNQLGAGDLVVDRAYILMYNGTAWELIGGGDSSQVAQATISGWDRPAAVAYPPITQVNPTTISVPGGTGRIVDPSARDISGVTEVSWATQNVVLTNVASQWLTIIGVNASGQIVQMTGSSMPAAARSTIILGIVTHVTGVIGSIKTRPTIYGDEAYMSYDTSNLFNNMLISGGVVTQNATALHMDLGAGIIFSIGGNADQKNGPNLAPFAGQVNFNFYPVTGASTNAALTNVAPVGNYDPLGAGVITAIPGGAGTAAIHRLYLIGDVMLWLYGQQIYTDMTTAIREWPIDTQTQKLPAKLNNATLIATVIATKGCLSLADPVNCRIVPAGGTTYSIGTAGSIGDAPVDGSSYGRKNAAWSKVVDAVISGDGITVNSADPNKPIVAVASTFAGPKTLTSGNWNLSATSDTIYSKTNFKMAASTADGADNCSMMLSGGGGNGGILRGASLWLYGNEGTAPGKAWLESNDIDIGNSLFAPGTFVTIFNSDLKHISPTGIFRYSNSDYRIAPDTADAADSSVLRLLGGGAFGTGRGASVSIFGNENGTLPGGVSLLTGAPGGVPAEVQMTCGALGVLNGRLYGTALHNNASPITGTTNQYVGSGTYVGTATNVGNISGAVSIVTAQFMRVGNVVTVSGRCSVTPTAATTLTQFRLSLPIASNLSTSNQLSGAGARIGTNATEAVNISGDIAADEALFSFNPSNNVSGFLTYQFTYLVA